MLCVPRRRDPIGERHVISCGIPAARCAALRHAASARAAPALPARPAADRRPPDTERSLRREVHARDIRSCRIAPTFRERRVDRIQYRVEASRQFVAARNPKRNFRLSDLVFCAHQPLAHRGRRHQKRRRDRRRIETEHDLQDQRRVNPRVYRRMGAREISARR